ncbi:MAG: site-2 protease family protein [Victivallaceae bacterium]
MELFFKGLEIAGAALFMVFFLGFCVFIHEFGHFLAARWRGLHVIAFSIGFKKAWSKKINGIDYRIGWLPFGGYVDVPQIDTTGVPKDENGNDLPAAKPQDRMVTAFAGPFFNILFGLTLGILVWVVGIPQDTPKMRSITVDAIDVSGPEYQGGLRVEDKITKINGERFFCTWNEFVRKILFSVGEVSFDVKRGDKDVLIKFVPRENPNAPEKMKNERVAWPFFVPRIPIELFPDNNSPASKAGVKKSDVLVEINGVKISNYVDFYRQISLSDGKPINIKVNRGGKIIEILNIVPELDKDIPEEDNNVYMIGIVYDPRTLPLKIIEVAKNYPAAKGGLLKDDMILALNGKNIISVEEFQKSLSAQKEKPFTLNIKRGEKVFDVQLTAKHIKYYTIGVGLAIIDHPSPVQQFVSVLEMSYKSLRSILYSLAKKIGLTESGSTLNASNLSGPIGLGQTLFVAVYKGSFMIGIYFVVMVSFALAVFNLLPLPVLDGGHIALAAIEIIFKRPLHSGVNKVLTFVFVFLLISLMLYVSYFDIMRRLLPINNQSAPAGKSQVVSENKPKIEGTVDAAKKTDQADKAR